MTSSASAIPAFPTLEPRRVDPLWHNVDAPKDEEAILTRMEQEQENRKRLIAKAYSDIPPIGKSHSEALDDEDDDDDDDDNDNDNDDNDDSDSHDEDEDAEMDLAFIPPAQGTGTATGGGTTPAPAAGAVQ